MGKKAKIGKKRKDKFYHLAKETGYRARSAFKLIQLNRKFGFLQESRVLIDLCAAPGGWLQVASNFMPISSVILGVDLVSIKPIKNVTTFQADITTEHCRQLLKKELKSWKSDVVLNDGAPNVGSAWVQDAFTQAQLALSALKLASEFLKPGGWFITKVFRSKDYTALLWVFQQLFKKVHSTKPQASRSESAEIFVVCQGYLAPDKLDEKFLDPRHVFKEIQQESKIRLNILKPEKHVRQREGYPENNITLHTTITAKEFINSSNAIDVLSTTNKIDIKDEEIKNSKITTEEIKLCCQDIKVLGKKELKALLTWRKKLRKILLAEKDSNKIEDSEATVELEKTEEDKEGELDQMISDLKEEESKDLKKKKKRIREQKKKLRERLAGKLADASGDTGATEEDLFALRNIKNKQELEVVEDDNAENLYVEDSEEEMEFETDEESESDVDSSEEEYVYGDDELYNTPWKKRKMEETHVPAKKSKKSTEPSNNPLLVDNLSDTEEANDETAVAVNKAKQWFQKDIFKHVEEESEDDMNDDYDIEVMLKNHKKKGGTIIEKENTKTNDGDKPGSDGDDHLSGDSSDEDDSDNGDDSEVDDRSISQGRAQQEADKEEKKKATKKNGFEIAPQNNVQLGPEALALGTAMVTSKKRKRDIIDDAYNRYSFNDSGLPSWFVEDEAKHTVRHIPVTRDEVDFYKQRLREINARPIKKVIEAKAKKKSQMLKKLDRARKKAQGILDASDVSSREKQDQIKGIYKRAGLIKKKTPAPTYVVAKKGLAGKKYKRPANVKGTYKVVDPRMKKDLKAMKNKEKTKGRKRKK